LAAADPRWEVSLPDAALMQGKPMALLRAVENLLVNAERHGAFPFALKLDRQGNAWQIEVSDQGAGLPAGASERVKQPFVHAGETGGSGLGLAIVDRIARQHGGDLVLLANTPNGLRALLRVRGA
jgi:two-component system osmolarity sensor histidine kinase EnvZ